MEYLSWVWKLRPKSTQPLIQRALFFIKRSTVKIADARAHHQKAKMPGLEALHSLVIYLHFEWFD